MIVMNLLTLKCVLYTCCTGATAFFFLLDQDTGHMAKISTPFLWVSPFGKSSQHQEEHSVVDVKVSSIKKPIRLNRNLNYERREFVSSTNVVCSPHITTGHNLMKMLESLLNKQCVLQDWDLNILTFCVNASCQCWHMNVNSSCQRWGKS